MRRSQVYTPDGVKITLDLGDPQLAQHIEQELIEPYKDLIEANWLGGKKHGFSFMEDRIKKYMERLGTLLIQDPGEHVILTASMQRRIAMRETELTDYMEDKPHARSKRVYQRRSSAVSTGERLRHLRQQYPGGYLTCTYVDTEGIFHLNGQPFRVTHPVYAPVQLSDDVYYPADRIAALRWKDRLLFFTQSLEPIQERYITRLAIPDREAERMEEQRHGSHDEQENV